MKKNILFLDSVSYNLFSQDAGGKVDLQKLFKVFDNKLESFEAHYFYQFHNAMNQDAYKNVCGLFHSFGWNVDTCLPGVNVYDNRYAQIIELTQMSVKAIQKAEEAYFDFPDDEFNFIFGVTHLSYAPLLQAVGNSYDNVNITLLVNPAKANPKLIELSDSVIDVSKLDIAM